MKHLFIYWGKVKEGKKRGKLLGFPTANISLSRKIPEGVYVSKLKAHGKNYAAVTFVGSAKTFGEKEYKSESYILDFNKNIYGEWVTIELFKKIRGNKKFSSEKLLITQMKEDIVNAEKVFNK